MPAGSVSTEREVAALESPPGKGWGEQRPGNFKGTDYPVARDLKVIQFHFTEGETEARGHCET